MDDPAKIDAGATRGRAWRLFVAISLPEAVKNEMEKTQRELRAVLPRGVVRWTKREQFHLTLKFLGDVAELRAAELIEALRTACRHFSALRLRAAGIGFFPDARRPRVIWAGAQDDAGALLRVQQSVEASVKDFATEDSAERRDLPPGRRRSQEFTGHVTLGRIQRIQRADAEILVKAASRAAGQFFGEWTADTVELIRSELSSGGSRYTTLAAIPLSNLT
jgi:RNA 2',3'-cyclic 3'-phosphodiesterase